MRLNVVKSITIGCFVAAILIGCTADSADELNSIQIDGSSTVYPITKEIAEKYQASVQETVDITVNFSGTGGGFKKFCEGKTDINNASRPIQIEEMRDCNQAKIRYIELPIAFDAITVVVNPQNNWLDSITVEELKKIWSPTAEEKITRWNQIRDDLPNQPLNLYFNHQFLESPRSKIWRTAHDLRHNRQFFNCPVNSFSHRYRQCNCLSLCIARAIALKPDVVLMDEPCSALDPISTGQVEELINQLKENYTIAIVTHNMQQAARISDMTAFFNAEEEKKGNRFGYLVEYNTTRKIFETPEEKATQEYVSGRFG